MNELHTEVLLILKHGSKANAIQRAIRSVFNDTIDQKFNKEEQIIINQWVVELNQQLKEITDHD